MKNDNKVIDDETEGIGNKTHDTAKINSWSIANFIYYNTDIH